MKKFLAMLLMLSMFLAMLVMPAAAEDEITDTFDPYAENPTISTANDYINFFNEVYTSKTIFEGKTITLLHDIVLNDTTATDWYLKEDAVKLVPPTIDKWSNFKGTVDGNGHTIKGIIVSGSEYRNDMNSGIFPYVSDGAAIKNLTIDGFYVYSTNTTKLPVFGRAGIGGLIGGAFGTLTIDNVTLRNGVIAAVDGGEGAMGALIGNYYGVLKDEDKKAGKTSLNLSITNTTVEESVRLVKGNSKVELMGGIVGYAEGNFQANPTIIDLSASKIQPSGSMDAENPLEPIGKFRFKGANDPTWGATYTVKNASTAYNLELPLDAVGAADVDDSGDGFDFTYKNCVDDFNDAFWASGCYGSKYQELKSYTVTWKVNGETSTEVYTQGATPSYKGSTDKPMTDTKLYVFKGWSPELAPVSADVTYTAEYDEFDKVMVTWSVDGKETVEYYKKGDMPNFKGETLKEQDEGHVYTFKGWDKDLVAAETDVTYTAVYEVKGKFKITWVIDGKETVETYLEGVKPSYKGKPSKAEDDEYTYTFAGWDKELVAASADATYTAVFDKTAKNGAATDESGEKSGGCGSSISLGLVSLMMIGMAGAFAFRKKHD